MKWEPTDLEIIESVDMLRILENGMDVKMGWYRFLKTKAVDTEADLKKVIEMMKTDFPIQAL